MRVSLFYGSLFLFLAVSSVHGQARYVSQNIFIKKREKSSVDLRRRDNNKIDFIVEQKNATQILDSMFTNYDYRIRPSFGGNINNQKYLFDSFTCNI